MKSFGNIELKTTILSDKLIKMEPLNVNITVSDLLDFGSSAIRGLWFKYDFFSDFCPSFKPQNEMKFLDLNEAVNIEWSVRKSMRDIHLEEMRKVREVYDQKMEEKRQEEEKSRRKNKGKVIKNILEKPSKIIVNVELEPPMVDEATYVDVEQEYLAYEDTQLNKERDSFLPENLGLTQHEVKQEALLLLANVMITLIS